MLKVTLVTVRDGSIDTVELGAVAVPHDVVKAPLSEYTTGALLDELRDRWTRENLELY